MIISAEKCTSEVTTLKGQPAESVVISNESWEVVNKICYLVQLVVLKKTLWLEVAGRNLGNLCF